MATARRSYPLNPVTVLIVDDVSVMRKCVRSLVETSPQARVVGEACNGTTAVSLAQHLHPNLVLMDVHMPGVNGVDATRRIKILAPQSSVIGMTAQREVGTELAMLGAGAETLLTKEDMVEGLPPVIERAMLTKHM
jgi:DNA-binding NarL/FixJ family response regulator